MLARISAYLSLVCGVWWFLAALSLWGAGAAAVLGPLALLAGWAALTEQPPPWTRRVALVGVTTGGGAIVSVLVWVGLGILGL